MYLAIILYSLAIILLSDCIRLCMMAVEYSAMLLSYTDYTYTIYLSISSLDEESLRTTSQHKETLGERVLHVFDVVRLLRTS